MLFFCAGLGCWRLQCSAAEYPSLYVWLVFTVSFMCWYVVYCMLHDFKSQVASLLVLELINNAPVCRIYFSVLFSTRNRPAAYYVQIQKRGTIMNDLLFLVLVKIARFFFPERRKSQSMFASCVLLLTSRLNSLGVHKKVPNYYNNVLKKNSHMHTDDIR